MINYEALAIMAIKKYLNINLTDEEIRNLYSPVIELMADNMKKNANTSGIQSMTQGSRTTSYFQTAKFGLTNEIKQLLPLPKVRMF